MDAIVYVELRIDTAHTDATNRFLEPLSRSLPRRAWEGNIMNMENN